MDNLTIVVIAGLLILAIVGKRRATASQAAKLEKVARGIRELRMRASLVPVMNPIAAHRGAIPNEFAAIGWQLEREGFRILGDVEELDLDGSVAGRLRWFTSADGTIFGWFGVAHGQHEVMLLLSEDAGRGFAATIRSPHASSTAVPETVRELRLRWQSGLSDALARHRENLRAMSAPVRVTDLTGALDSLRRLKEHVAGWRARQDPDALLEADVRRIAEDRFEQLGPSLIALVQMLEAIDAMQEA